VQWVLLLPACQGSRILLLNIQTKFLCESMIQVPHTRARHTIWFPFHIETGQFSGKAVIKSETHHVCRTIVDLDRSGVRSYSWARSSERLSVMPGLTVAVTGPANWQKSPNPP
jgi:hypothetical protein